MKLANSEQMRSIDNEAINKYGIPGMVLMENAAIKVCSHINKEDIYKKGNICIVCGKGNNGGDGFAVSRHLLSRGMDISIFLVGDENSLKGDAFTNYNILRNMGIEVTIINKDNLKSLSDAINKSSMVIDGLLGTGIKGEVTSFYRDVIEIINEHSTYVLSIDVPSGINADSGEVMGGGIKANKTITFALPKIGLYAYPGAEYAGEVFVEDICIPWHAVERQKINTNLLTGKDIKCLLSPRRKDTNKGTYGRAFIIAGSKGMMGAASMCGMAALRSGAGLVELGVPTCIQKGVAPMVMEAIVKGLHEEDGRISAESTDDILESLNKASAFAIGPGLSKSDGLLKILSKILGYIKYPGVIDADGLNLLSENLKSLYNTKQTMIVTPHPGEMSRLVGENIDFIQKNRIECARKFSLEYKVVTVLKGANTVIASPEGEVYINVTGNPGMAKGGSGDILTGIIVSFLAQGIEPFDAAKISVYIHGLAGDMACCSKGEYGMKAQDIIDHIPYAIREAVNL